MKIININGVDLPVKDYYCKFCQVGCDRAKADLRYDRMLDPKFWLYVKVTDDCNANCPFCVNRAIGTCSGEIDEVKFERMLESVKDRISGLSFTGGEPMLYRQKLDKLIPAAEKILGKDTEIDIVTNGMNIPGFSTLGTCLKPDSIHISRHAVDDALNRKLMGWPEAPTVDELRDYIDWFAGWGITRFVFNCVLQKDGIHDIEGIAEYLEMAIWLYIDNTSFITMFPANEYCKKNYVMIEDPVAQFEKWNSEHDSQFRIWNIMKDHEYCSCLTGDYRSKNGNTRFYFRMPGKKTADYCRQLVFQPDNRLTADFGKDAAEIPY
ncbi:MAG: radical SAM protein [Oscillospiraceae bacterium]|nr:radical SAM protein [Oscillospiraceae bacterium]